MRLALWVLLLIVSLLLLLLGGLPLVITGDGDMGGRGLGIFIIVVFGPLAALAAWSLVRSPSQGGISGDQPDR